VLERRKLEASGNQEKGVGRVSERRRRCGWDEADRRRDGVLVLASSQQSDRAFVIHRGRAAVNLFMQLRDRRKNEREQNRRQASSDDDRAQNEFPPVGEPQFHRTREFLPNQEATQG